MNGSLKIIVDNHSRYSTFIKSPPLSAGYDERNMGLDPNCIRYIKRYLFVLYGHDFGS